MKREITRETVERKTKTVEVNICEGCGLSMEDPNTVVVNPIVTVESMTYDRRSVRRQGAMAGESFDGRYSEHGKAVQMADPLNGETEMKANADDVREMCDDCLAEWGMDE